MLKDRCDRNSGFILPMVILAMFSIAFFAVVVHSMGSGYSNQVTHVDEFARCRAIAESAYAKVLARVRNKPYRERFFAKAPCRELGVSLFNGQYNLYIVDTPGHKTQADVYVEAIYQRCSRLFFWRVKFERSIFDAVGRALPLLFVTRDASDFPLGGTGSPLAGFVDDLIKTRDTNNISAATKDSMVKSLTDTQTIITVLDGPTGVALASDPDHGALPIAPPPPLGKPPLASPTVIYEEHFDSDTGGTIPGFKSDGKGVLAGYSQNPPNCYQQVAGPTNQRNELLPIPLTNRLIYSFRFMVPVDPQPTSSTDEGGDIGLALPNFHFEAGWGFFTVMPEGTLSFDAGVSCEQLGNWVKGTWYSFRAEIDFDAQAADLYLNGTLVREKLALPAKSKLAPGVCFGVSGPTKNDGPMPFFVDDIVIAN